MDGNLAPRVRFLRHAFVCEIVYSIQHTNRFTLINQQASEWRCPNGGCERRGVYINGYVVRLNRQYPLIELP